LRRRRLRQSEASVLRMSFLRFSFSQLAFASRHAAAASSMRHSRQHFASFCYAAAFSFLSFKAWLQPFARLMGQR